MKQPLESNSFITKTRKIPPSDIELAADFLKVRYDRVLESVRLIELVQEGGVLVGDVPPVVGYDQEQAEDGEDQTNWSPGVFPGPDPSSHIGPILHLQILQVLFQPAELDVDALHGDR